MEGEVADTQLGGHLPDEVRSATEHHTAVVVGGGQSGLATAYYLRRYEVDFLILDNQEEPGGAWLHAWPSLTLFSAAEFSNLPGWPMPQYPGYPPASHVIDYLEHYERRYDLPVRRPVHVRSVSHDGGMFFLDSTVGQFTADHVVAATGTWSAPFVPPLSRHLPRPPVALVDLPRPRTIPRREGRGGRRGELGGPDRRGPPRDVGGHMVHA